MEGRQASLSDLARLVGGRVRGDPEFIVTGISSLDDATNSQISFAVNHRLAQKVYSSRAGAFILPESWPEKLPPNVIEVRDPYLAYALVANYFVHSVFVPRGVSPGASVAHSCCIHEEVTIEAGVVIGEGSTIGRHVHIYPGVVIGKDVEVLDETVIFPNVVIYDGCRIGRRVRIHAGVVIGADGFGYAQGPDGMVKIPQIGIVVIEDDVEIGANTTIDRAALGETRIGMGTKIDNLVMIAHNVGMGKHCVIVSQVGISGSTKVGSGVMMGGQVGVVGHIKIGDGARIGAKSGVPQSIGPGETVSGIPAMAHVKWLRMVNVLKRLPDLLKEVRNIKKRLERLEDHGKRKQS